MDYITIGIILVCVIVGYVKGLLISVFNMLSLFISFFLTRNLYPHVSAFLRGTPLFSGLKDWVAGWIGRSVVVPDTGQIVTDTVNSMPLPEMFRSLVLENLGSAPELDLTTVYDYVADFAARIACDGIAILLVFVSVFLLMRILAGLLRIVSRMPVIKTFNRIGGGVMGLIIGALLSWLSLSVMKSIFAANTDFPVSDMLAESVIAKFFLFNI
jgi:uncharacterized membrane protein required for colicin V production